MRRPQAGVSIRLATVIYGVQCDVITCIYMKCK